MNLTALATTASDLVIAASDSDDGSGFGFLFLLAGPVFYGLMFLRYRNSDKRHRHESETKASMHDVRASDQLSGSLKGVKHRRMKGANNTAVRGAGGVGGALGGLTGLGDSLGITLD